jgi:hypothetical protein
MTKNEMVTLLRSVGVNENTVTGMENAYEMGFEQGAVAYKHLRSAVEAGRDVCKYLDHDKVDDAKGHVQFFWDALDSIRAMEWEREE